ncbi:IMP dehydrogenase [Candidatus Peregrinibacteria bacterium]|nr:IMP dehydrogenase [Candidatus Peregrinibacteria bacterium]
MSEDLYNQVNFLSPEGHLLFPEKLTFDDVLLIPEYSEVLPRDTRVHTRISKNIILKIPFISAAMDTVTESRMAVEMALAGGIGIIHKNLAPDEQAAEVKIVKRFENGFIKNPVVLPPTAKISDAYIIRRDVGYKAIPITENGRLHGKLLGILTSNDYFINRHGELLVSERMTPSEKLLTAPEGTSLERAHEILEESKHSKLLIVSASGNLVALVTRRDLERKQDFPDASLDKDGRLLCGAAVGPAKNMEERVQKLAEAEVDLFVVDTAHGHSKGVADTVRYIKKKYPKIVVIGGNIASKEAVQFLKDAGADGVKVGIGPGSICTTRIISGVGMPQFSAILDTAAEAKKLQISLIADGGIKYSGDAVKALAAGADAVMIGSIFAGTEESPGELIYANGKTYKSYRGMGSLSAMKEGGKERYAQGDVESEEKFVPEGIEGRILFKGSVRNEIYQMVGGLKSALGYQGCASLEELHQKAKFIRVTSAAVKESHPHDITISREAPNYRGNYE